MPLKFMENAITKLEALNFISDISRAFSQNDDPEQLLDKILSASIEVSSADSGSIMLLNPEKQFLEIHASRGLTTGSESLKLQVGEGVTGWVAKYGKPRLVGDAAAESDYITVKEGLCSELAVPMLIKEEIIGVLSVDSNNIDAFTLEHQHFLSIMSNLAAMIFVNLKDNQVLKFRDRFHRVLIDISRIISQSLQLEEVFREIMTVTEKAFRLFQSSLLLYDATEDKLKITAAMGLSRDEIKDVSYEPGEGISGSVFLNKSPEFIPDVSQEPGFLNRMKFVEKGAQGVGFFCCPIFSGQETVGVFSTFTRHQSGIDPGMLLEFLEIMGSIISQAVTIQKLVRDETRVIEFENLKLKRQLSSKYQFGNLIGRTQVMNELLNRVGLVADSRASVLITGESGTGKELIASAIHYNSPRRDEALVKINCAAIPENLLESELFGHRKGSFTGAINDKKGKFELAHGGTVFLDEIGELDLNLQSKLLRVLQEKEIEPIGGRLRKVDIRVITATNANLEEKIEKKEFRSDLYYRLNVINLKLPPLRERRGDIILLVQHFIDKYKTENNKKIRGISPEAMQWLENCEWPGNVRQLENAIERAIVLSQSEVLGLSEFQDIGVTGQKKQDRVGQHSLIPFSNDAIETLTTSGNDFFSEEKIAQMEGHIMEIVIGEVEKKLITMALKRFRYTKTQAARFLGINRNTLDKKIKKLSIE